MNMGGMPPPNPMNGVQAPPSNKRNKRPPQHQQQQFQQNKPPPNPMNNNRPPPNPKEKKGGKNSKFSGLMNKFENKGQIMGSHQRPSNNQNKQIIICNNVVHHRIQCNKMDNKVRHEIQ